MVKVRGNDVAIKTITVQDGSGKAKVTLWRETSEVDLHTGEFVKITNVTVNMYENDTSLSTTGKSIVERCEAPVILENPILVVAVGINDGQAELLLSDDTEVTVPSDILAQVMTDERSVEELTSDGPVDLGIIRRGNEVISINIV